MLCAIIIPIVNVAAFLYLIFAFFVCLGLGISMLTHIGSVMDYRKYLEKVRAQVVRSRTFDDYLFLYAAEQH